MLGAALFALAADDLKRVLAWSTVSQLAYMFAALVARRVRRRRAAPAVARRLQGAAVPRGRLGDPRGRDPAARRMGGLRRAMPVTFVTMTIGFAALAGLPPLVGFFSKDDVLGVASEQAFDGVPAPVAGSSWSPGCVAALTAAYATRAWLMVFFGPRRSDRRGVVPRESRLADAGSARRAGRRLACWAASRCSWPDFLGVEARRLALRWSSWSSLAVVVARASALRPRSGPGCEQRDPTVPSVGCGRSWPREVGVRRPGRTGVVVRPDAVARASRRG